MRKRADVEGLAVAETVNRIHGNLELLILELKLTLKHIDCTEEYKTKLFDSVEPFRMELTKLAQNYILPTYNFVKANFPSFMNELVEDIETYSIAYASDKYNIGKVRLADLYEKYKSERSKMKRKNKK